MIYFACREKFIFTPFICTICDLYIVGKYTEFFHFRSLIDEEAGRGNTYRQTAGHRCTLERECV